MDWPCSADAEDNADATRNHYEAQSGSGPWGRSCGPSCLVTVKSKGNPTAGFPERIAGTQIAADFRLGAFRGCLVGSGEGGQRFDGAASLGAVTAELDDAAPGLSGAMKPAQRGHQLRP